MCWLRKSRLLSCCKFSVFFAYCAVRAGEKCGAVWCYCGADVVILHRFYLNDAVPALLPRRASGCDQRRGRAHTLDACLTI